MPSLPDPAVADYLHALDLLADAERDAARRPTTGNLLRVKAARESCDVLFRRTKRPAGSTIGNVP